MVEIPAGHKGVLFRNLGEGTVLDRARGGGGSAAVAVEYDECVRHRVIGGEDTIDALTSDGLRVNAELWYRYRPLTDSLGALYKLVDAHSSMSAMLTSWQWGAVPADGCVLPCTDDRPDRAQYSARQLYNFCTWNAKPWNPVPWGSFED